MIKHLLLLATLLAAVPPLRAEAEIQRFFARLEGYRFVMRWETTDPARVETRGHHSRGLLEESALISASAWTIRPPQGAEFPLLVFETEDSSGAFLLFTRWRLGARPEARTLDLPIGHLHSPRDAAFWRGNFFFRLGDGSAPVSQAVFEAFVGDIFRAVSAENLLPVSVSHIPEEELVPDSLRFYLGPASLAENERFPEPLLDTVGLADRIEIAFGRYEPGDDALFLIGYPTPTLADENFRRLQGRLQEFFSDEGIFMKRAGVLVCLFVGPEDRALDVLNRVRYEPTIKWFHDKRPEREPSETVKFLRLLTRTFLGTGLLLLMMIGLGIAVGLFRYEMLRRFPTLVRKKEMIRLRLDE